MWCKYHCGYKTKKRQTSLSVINLIFTILICFMRPLYIQSNYVVLQRYKAWSSPSNKWFALSLPWYHWLSFYYLLQLNLDIHTGVKDQTAQFKSFCINWHTRKCLLPTINRSPAWNGQILNRKMTNEWNV